jgi:two-component system, chemotaxis family, CheB/CheR fusion protein
MQKNDVSLESKNENLSKSSAQNFPIVGVGASAGGLDAIKKLLQSLPENTGLAFVIIQHLATGQESMLPEILSRFTKMPVNKVQSGEQIDSNQIYVIPSGTAMTIENGTLQLKPKREFHKPIDEFLVSLAHEKKTHSIGIILSGTGTDGTDGLKSIKGEGGITFAQDPKSAQYPDMPKNAISAETVDFVLVPERIAQELVEIAKHPEIIRKKIEPIEAQAEEGGNDKQVIFNILKASFNVNFANYKKSTTDRRISRRMVLKNVASINKYVLYLRTHKDELQALFEDLLIGVTGFFREPETFNVLKESIFLAIVEKKMPNQPIRVWVPGCSTGEEAYSIAMVIQEFLEEKNILDLQIQVFGTDVNGKNIDKARRGIYLKAIEDTIPEKRLKRFFTSFNGNYQIIKQVRDMCVFAKHDLTNDPPFSNMDLIVCRNVLIYFDAKLQEKMVPLFHYGLKPDCYLVLGESESVGKFTYLFEPMTKKGVIFKKKPAQPRVEFQTEAPTTSLMGKLLEQPIKTDSMVLLAKEVDRLLMSEFVPASLVLNSNLDVLGFRGKVDPYLSIDAGTATFNATKMVQKELRPALQTAVYKAKKYNKEIKEAVRTEQDKQTKTVTIQIKPISLSKHENGYFLVLFGETVKVKPSRQTIKDTSVQEVVGVKDQQIKELSEDLDSTKQTLQTVIEQHEATNEELRSSMEELQSGNEELMSTNEELETAKEELQSTNEELTTLNDELKNRNQTVSHLNDDLVNLMDNVDTAVVIVDNDYKIKRFTASAQELLRLTPNDVEHPVTEIRLGIPTEELKESLSTAINKLSVVRKEIDAGKDRWFQMRIRPYITQDKKISGAVLSFSDITEMKAWENERKLHTETLEQRVQEQAGELLDAESLVAIGKTAGMVGHDIRNPLQAITSDIYLVKSELGSLPESEEKKGIKESLDGIEKNVEYINKIVSDLQDFARKEAPQFGIVNVETIVQEVLSSINIPEHITVSNTMEKGFPALTLDESHIKRILTNLISNAVQAMPTTGKLTITAFRQNNKAVINVEDNGIGIPEELRSKMFKPLFTTKAKGQGFGLAVVKKLTEAMNGTVTFESKNGNGTKFILSFPIP